MASCNFCFSSVSKVAPTFACPQCQPVPDPSRSRIMGAQVSGPRVRTFARPADHRGRWRPPTTAFCDECGTAMTRCCDACHMSLLPQWLDGETLTVALAGGRFTGKTVFIAQGIRTLEQFVVGGGGNLEWIDDAGRKTYRDSYEKILLESVMPGATSPLASADSTSRTPLAMRVNRAGRSLNISMRDVAGEDLEADEHVKFLDVIGRADLIVYLFDPMAVPEVRNALAGLVTMENVSQHTALDVLERTLQHVGANSTRLAVCVSKFDLFHTLRTRVPGGPGQAASGLIEAVQNPAAAMSRDARTPDEVEEDGPLIDAEIRSLLEYMGAQSFVNGVTNLAERKGIKLRFFAVSALGGPPAMGAVDPQGIAPFRCADPLFWAARAKGVL